MSPGNDRGGPREEAASNVITTDTTSIPQQIRRRRDAANRCEPLECGHRDPLDCDRPNPDSHCCGPLDLRALRDGTGLAAHAAGHPEAQKRVEDAAWVARGNAHKAEWAHLRPHRGIAYADTPEFLGRPA